MLAYLREHFLRHQLEKIDEMPGFCGGAIGTFNFSCAAWFEPTVRSGKAASDAELSFYSSVVAFDHVKQAVKIITLVFAETDSDDAAVAQLITAAEEANEACRQKLFGPLPDIFEPASTDSVGIRG